MHPYTASVIEVFDPKRRYLIPLYQRQYAWNVSPQLELLWEDIERAARKLRDGGLPVAPHFMGAIVVSKMETWGKQVEAFEVIDGQQRLTTFQLLLAALRDVAKDIAPEFAEEASKYLFNNGIMETPKVERYKLWPSAIDRPAFQAILDQNLSEEKQDYDASLSAQAHEFFKERIFAHIHVDGQFDLFRMEKLFEALRRGLALVSIELGKEDDAQTIFETLNSRGVDLTAGDLMRNFIFQRAKGLGQFEGSLCIDELYDKYWLPLDAPFWRQEDKRGRLNRSRLDWLLVDHLSMKKADLVSADHLFDEYRRWILDASPFASVEEELKSITASAATHQRLIGKSSDDSLGRFGLFAEAFDLSAAMPLVLYLATEKNLGEGLASALELIESYIVRRDICNLTGKNYNRFFVSIISKLRASPDDPIANLRAFLSESQAEASRWPDDIAFERCWITNGQYKSGRQGRLRFILTEIEHHNRAENSEIISIKSDLTLEHIMPRGWETNWPLPEIEGEDPLEKLSRQAQRSIVVDTLGNLTLLTQSLNSSVLNGPFSEKMAAIRKQTALNLNVELQEFDDWNEETIKTRGKKLFQIARSIWRAPMKVGAPKVISQADGIGFMWESGGGQLFLPHGTDIRMTYKSQDYFAKVEADQIVFAGKATSPGSLANGIANSSRNAWRDLWIKFPGEDHWTLSNDLRANLPVLTLEDLDL
jgi:hypothetical protein